MDEDDTRTRLDDLMEVYRNNEDIETPAPAAGWGVTLRRWSVQITLIQMPLITAVGIATAITSSLWVALGGMFVCLLVCIAQLIAANMPQANLATYDPARFRLVAKGER